MDLLGEVLVNVNPPIFGELAPIFILEGASFEEELAISNIAISGVLQGAPSGLTFNPETKALQWANPTLGIYEFQLEVANAFGQDSDEYYFGGSR